MTVQTVVTGVIFYDHDVAEVLVGPGIDHDAGTRRRNGCSCWRNKILTRMRPGFPGEGIYSITVRRAAPEPGTRIVAIHRLSLPDRSIIIPEWQVPFSCFSGGHPGALFPYQVKTAFIPDGATFRFISFRSAELNVCRATTCKPPFRTSAAKYGGSVAQSPSLEYFPTASTIARMPSE